MLAPVTLNSALPAWLNNQTHPFNNLFKKMNFDMTATCINQWKQSKIEQARKSLINREADERSSKLQQSLKAFFNEHSQKEGARNDHEDNS